METLKKQTNIRGDVKVTETDKYSWRRERNRQIQRNRQIFVETLKKQINIRGDVKETDKSTWRSEDVKETDKYWWRRQRNGQIYVEK